jgi:conjugal transfer pilus assembly protein TraB
MATQQSSVQDIVGSGVGKGIESSSSRLSEYLIKRAEQYQPVISIAAGIDVELVFIDGVYLDGKGGTDENQKVK